jgi:Domain of unknown function (DUF6379)
MKASRLVEDDSLRVSGDGLEVQIRLPWYRGLQLSTVDINEVRINGETIDHGKMRFTVNGKERPADNFAAYYEEYWYVLDSGYLRVPYAAKKDATYEVEVTVTLYPPYIHGIPFRTTCKKSMRAN